MQGNQVTTALTAFIERAIPIQGDKGFEAIYDPEWQSPCELAPSAPGIVRWHPLRQVIPVDFRGLANAVGAPVHPDIVAFYSSYWSGHLEATSHEGPVSLIQLWNKDDFNRLIENLIGHLLVKQRSKATFTVFFANTDPDSQLFLSVDNESGKVLLEEPGRAPLKVVEDSLARFIDRLTPLPAPPGIYG